MSVPTTTNVRCINTRYLLQDLRAVQSMALADILVNGIFSTPITFGLEDKEANDEGLASVVENAFSTSNAPQISEADADSSKSGKEDDENKEGNNNKDEEKEIRDTTTAPAVKDDNSASNSGQIVPNGVSIEYATLSSITTESFCGHLAPLIMVFYPTTHL